MKTLYVNGSSTVYGRDLTRPKDDTFYKSNKDYRENTVFPALIKKEFGFDNIINDAEPASSIDRICRTTIYSLSDLLKTGVKDIFCVISFSPGTPIDFYSNKLKKYFGTFIVENYLTNIFPEYTITGEIPYKDSALRGIQKIYESNFLNFVFVADTFIQKILLLQNFLKSNNIKYLFMHTAPVIPSKVLEDGSIDLTAPGDNNEALIKYYKEKNVLTQIDKTCWVDFLSNSILEETNKDFLGRGKTGHILADGHKYWFDYIRKDIEKIWTPI